MKSRHILAHKLNGGSATYERPSYRDIQRNFLATEETQFDRIERGAVSGGVPLVWAKVEVDAAIDKIAVTRNLTQ